uniref:Protein AF-10 n=2 Tax=Cacopsylla melanoneura TaxID=428564 RepID=A0A8D8YAF8_9HEMI
MKEMLGGCCVCSDDSGWAENPLVYCDGQGCSVAVHQACYGIVTVPTGNWFCRKCESNEKSTKVRCELCPSKDGALKRTDNSGWAHVVCALYIPEVRFGNVTSMEPILLEEIPPERFNKICYICEESGHKASRSKFGACMMCNKTGCRQQFHVTCAQTQGLLCEEAGNYLDNVKYCGYCSHHYSKLVRKKGANIKPIPPYRPAQTAEPEKELSMTASSNQNASSDTWSSGKQAPKRKKSTSNTPDPKMESNENAMNLLSLSQASTSVPSSDVTSETGVDNGAKVRKRRTGGSDTLEDKKPRPDLLPAADRRSADPPDTRQNSATKSNDTRYSTQQNSVLMPNPNPSSRIVPLAGASVSGTSNSNPQSRDTKVVVSISLSPKYLPDQDTEMTNTTDPEPHSTNTTPSAPETMYEKITPESSPEETRKNKANPGSGPVKPQPSSTPGTSSTNPSAPSTPEESTKKIIQNGAAAPHIMLGNQLNPNSTMAQKMTETLNSELEAHSIYTAEPNLNSTQLVGPPLPKARSSEPSPSNVPSSNSGTPWTSLLSSSMPPTLDQLLERQWDLGSQFLMEQAQNYDIAALLTCLHKLRTENSSLDDQVVSLKQRRDQLLAINARLAIPLTPAAPPPQQHMNQMPPVSQQQPQPLPTSAPPTANQQQAQAQSQQRSSTILHAMPVSTSMHPPSSRGPYQSHPMEQQQSQPPPQQQQQQQYQRNALPNRHQMPPNQGLNFRNIGVQGRTVVMRSSPSYDTAEFDNYAEEQNNYNRGPPPPAQQMNYQNHMYSQQVNRNDHHSKGGPHPHSKQN